MDAIFDTRIKKAVTFRDVLHRFCAGGETGTAIMELKIMQELACVDQDPIFLVFLDLRKAYDNLDRGRLLNTLEGYGAGPKMRDIMEEFWERQGGVTAEPHKGD